MHQDHFWSYPHPLLSTFLPALTSSIVSGAWGKLALCSHHSQSSCSAPPRTSDPSSGVHFDSPSTCSRCSLKKSEIHLFAVKDICIYTCTFWMISQHWILEVWNPKSQDPAGFRQFPKIHSVWWVFGMFQRDYKELCIKCNVINASLLGCEGLCNMEASSHSWLTGLDEEGLLYHLLFQKDFHDTEFCERSGYWRGNMSFFSGGFLKGRPIPIAIARNLLECFWTFFQL